MADTCCKSETSWCEPPALVLPGQSVQGLRVPTAPPAADGSGCLLPQGRAPVFSRRG